MPFNTVKKSARSYQSGKFVDLAEEDRKQIELYRIYGNQNPAIRTRRGRAVE